MNRRTAGTVCLILTLILTTALWGGAAAADIRFGDHVYTGDETFVDLGETAVTDFDGLAAFLEQMPKVRQVNMFGTGVPNEAFAKYFIGDSFLNPLTEFGKAPLFLANVTFEPGCRNNWHIHHADKGGGQILICTAGEGWYQEEGKKAQELLPGTVVVIPANTKHWHGAKADSWFSHISVEVPGENTSNEWFEPVDDDWYGGLKG